MRLVYAADLHGDAAHYAALLTLVRWADPSRCWGGYGIRGRGLRRGQQVGHPSAAPACAARPNLSVAIDHRPPSQRAILHPREGIPPAIGVTVSPAEQTSIATCAYRRRVISTPSAARALGAGRMAEVPERLEDNHLRRFQRALQAAAVAVATACLPLCPAVAAAAAAGGASGPVTPASVQRSTQAPQALAHSVSPLVSSGKARRVGPLAPGQVLRLAFVLQPRDPAGLLAVAAARRQVSAAQYQADFAPPASAVQAVRGFSAGAGLSVVQQLPGMVVVQGTAAQVSAALHITLNDYRAGTRTFYANADDPTVPGSVAAAVAGIVGLTQVEYSAGPAPTTPVPATATGTDAAQTYGFTPDAVRTAYGLIPAYGNGVTGAGTDIAVVMSGAFNPSDVQTFSQTFGLPYNPAQIVAVQAVPQVPPTGLDTESTLDVEWAHAIAPGATITEYESGDLSEVDLMAAFDKAISGSTAPVAVNMSFGAAEIALPVADAAAWHALFAEAVARGITPVAAAGDFGAYVPGLPLVSVDAPADDPLVLAVGGTHLTLARNNTRIGETAYEDLGSAPGFQPGLSQASGGGCSVVFSDLTRNEPSSAQHTCPGGARPVPDVSMAGQYVELYMTGPGWELANGTSFAAPMWSGLLALAAQRAGHGLGWVRPVINRLGGNPADFFDVTQGGNGLYSAGPGWDAVTGWGSPGNGWTLVQDLASAAPAPAAGGPQIAGVIVGGMPLFGSLISNGSGTVDVIGSGFGASQGTVTLSDGRQTYTVPVEPNGWKDSDITLNIDSNTGGLFAAASPPAGTYTLTVTQGAHNAGTTVTLADFLYITDGGSATVSPAGAQKPAAAQTVGIGVYAPDGLPDPAANTTASLYVEVPPVFATGLPPAVTVWQGGNPVAQSPDGSYTVQVVGGLATVQVASSGAATPTAGGPCVYVAAASGMNLGCDVSATFLPQGIGLGLAPDVFEATPGGPTYAAVYTGTQVPVLLLDPEGNLVPSSDTLGVTMAGTVTGSVYVDGANVHNSVTGATYAVPVTLSGGEATLTVTDDAAGQVPLAVYDASNVAVQPFTLPLTFTAATHPKLEVLIAKPEAAPDAAEQLAVWAIGTDGLAVPFPGPAYLMLGGTIQTATVTQQVGPGVWQTLPQTPLGYPIDLNSGEALVEVQDDVAGTETYQVAMQFAGNTVTSAPGQEEVLPSPVAAAVEGFPVLPHMATSSAGDPQYTPVEAWTVDAYGNVTAPRDPLRLVEAPGGPPVTVAGAGTSGGVHVVTPLPNGGWTVPNNGTGYSLFVASTQTGVADFTLSDTLDTASPARSATFQIDFVNSTPTSLAVDAPPTVPGGTQTVTVRVVDQNLQPVVNDTDRIALSIGNANGAVGVTDAAGTALARGAGEQYVTTADAGVATFHVSTAGAEVLHYTLTDLTDPAVAGATAQGLFANSLVVTTTSLPAATLGVAYNQALQAGGGVPPYTWTLAQGPLPAGLTLAGSGPLSGTPVAAGTFPVTVAVYDSAGAQATASLSLQVQSGSSAGGPAPGGGTTGSTGSSGSTGSTGSTGSSNSNSNANQPSIQTGFQVLETVNTATGPQTVETSGGTLQLLLPEGAFPGTVSIDVTQVAGAPPAPQGTTLLGPVWSFDAGTVVLQKPATATFAVPPLPAGVSAAQLALYTLVNGQWTFVEMTSPGTAPNQVTASLPHFSEWALMAVTKTFPDVPSTQWAFRDVEALVARGIVGGYPNGTFQPAADVTRAEFVKMLDLALGIQPALLPAQPFRDVAASAWYAPYIDAAYQAHLFQGSGGLALPDQPITREEAAVILARALGPGSVTSGPVSRFTDSASIASWAVAAVDLDASQGLLRGYPDGSFRPTADLARDEAVAVLVRLIRIKGA